MPQEQKKKKYPTQPGRMNMYEYMKERKVTLSKFSYI